MSASNIVAKAATIMVSPSYLQREPPLKLFMFA
jgi:hypothetical protein